MSHILSVKAKCGRLQATAGGGKSGYNTQLVLRVGSVEQVTHVVAGTNPNWGQEFFFEVHSPLEELDVTLQSKGWFSKDTLGGLNVLLYDVPFSEEKVEGCWFELTQETQKGEESSGHQVLLQLHFDPDPNVSPRDAAKSWKQMYIDAGGTEPVIIEESDESKAGSYKEEVGDVYSDGEMYTPNAAGFVRGESDDYTSEDADEEEEEEEEEDEPDSGEQGIVSTEGSEGSSDALNGSYKLPGGNQVASHATKAKATASLPIGISQEGISGYFRPPVNRGRSLSQPRIVEPDIKDDDFERSSGSCHSGDEGKNASMARNNSGSSRVSDRKRRIASSRHRICSKRGEKNMRDRSDAISEGSPNPRRGFSLSSAHTSLDEELGSPGSSLRAETARSGSRPVSCSEVSVHLEPPPTSPGGMSNASTDTPAKKHWNKAIDKATESLNRRSTLSDVVTFANTYNPAMELNMSPVAAAPGTFRKSMATRNARAEAAIKRRLAILGRRNVLLCNEQLQIHVYHKTIQALMYPLSDNKEHSVVLVTFKKPAYCYECGSLLWGLARQGMKCTDCGIKCHKRCLELLNADCLQRAAERYAKEGDDNKTGYFKRMMVDKINKRQHEKNGIFECIRQVFAVPQKQHDEVMVNAKQSILEGLSVWSAKVKVCVIEAQGLTAQDKTGTSDPYVTVQVGHKKVKTDVVHQNLNPRWNQSFEFECHESSDRIKVRVWDEDRDIKAAIANALTREPDDFLGQTIIEVYSLSGEMDVWYSLDRRDRSAVSGAIHLRINVEVEGEEKKAPFHMQYTSLHENMFDFLDRQGDYEQMMAYTQAQDNSLMFFKEPAQDIIQEFALRYGIENIYQTMTHFSCLSMRYATPGMPKLLGKLLVLINLYFRDHASQWHSTGDGAKGSKQAGQFLTSNFKREKFEEVLNRLMECLLLDLKSYRDVYPAEQEQKLLDLQAAIQLLTSIMFFRQKFLNESSAVRAKELVVECVQASIISTFNHLRDETLALVMEGTSTDSLIMAAKMPEKMGVDEEKKENLVNSLTYVFRLIDLVAQLVEQDQTVYAPHIQECFKDMELGHTSATMLWGLVLEDLHILLKSPEVLEDCATADFMNLMFKVKWFFDKHVAKVPGMAERSKEYHQLFSPFVRAWLMETVDKFDDILKNALRKDQAEKFKPMSEHNQHSWSVVDIFTAMTQCHTVLQSTGCTVSELQGQYDMLFATLVSRVLTQYTAFLKGLFATTKPDIAEACILLNNADQLRVRLEILYKKMGGEMIGGTEAGVALTDLQKVLKLDLDELCLRLAKGLEENIRARVEMIPQTLSRIKTGTPPTEAEAHSLIDPVFEVMFKRIEALLNNCNKTIVRRVLKELYRLMLTHLLGSVILPPLSTVRGLARDRNGSDLTQIQCQAIAMCLKAAQDFFYADGRGLKRSYLTNECPEKKRIDVGLEMFSSSTDSLISRFIAGQKNQDKLGLEEQVGQICVQVDIFEAQTEQKVTVKVVSASQLLWPTTVSGIFRPFVEITLLGPALAGVRRKQETRSKTKNPPAYNETFSYPLSNICDLTMYELHFAVRDYCFGRSKPLVGSTVLPLSTVHAANGSLMAELGIGRSLTFNEVGQDILCVLSQRPQDEIADEFVTLKLEKRTVDMS